MRRHRVMAAVLIGLSVQGTRNGLANGPTSGDPRFAATVAEQVGGRPTRLVLTGTAVRKKFGVTVYTVASYLREGSKVKDAETLAGIDAAKQLRMIFDRDVDGPTLTKAFRASIGMSHPAPAFAAELAELERYFLVHPLKKGDQVWLTHIPGVGLGCQVNGQPSHVFGGVAFSRAAWGTFLGPNNLGVAIKTGLTSRL